MPRTSKGPRKVVTLATEWGAWSGNLYVKAECGCGWRGSKCDGDRDGVKRAVRQAKTHHYDTKHSLELDAEAVLQKVN